MAFDLGSLSGLGGFEGGANKIAERFTTYVVQRQKESLMLHLLREQFSKNRSRAQQAGVTEYGQVFERLRQQAQQSSNELQQITQDSAMAAGAARAGLGASWISGAAASDLLASFERTRLFQESVVQQNQVLAERAANMDLEAARQRILARVRAGSFAMPQLASGMLAHAIVQGGLEALKTMAGGFLPGGGGLGALGGVGDSGLTGLGTSAGGSVFGETFDTSTVDTADELAGFQSGGLA